MIFLHPSHLRLRDEGLKDAMDRLYSSDGPIATVSDVVGQGNAVSTRAQSAYATAQTFSTSVEPIGRALQSFAQVVRTVDGLAEVSREVTNHPRSCANLLQVHPIAKAAWIVLSCVYKGTWLMDMSFTVDESMFLFSASRNSYARMKISDLSQKACVRHLHLHDNVPACSRLMGCYLRDEPSSFRSRVTYRRICPCSILGSAVVIIISCHENMLRR